MSENDRPAQTGPRVDDSVSNDGTPAESDVPVQDNTGPLTNIFPLVVLCGVVLFLFPEPATSMIGAILMAGGAIGWFIDYFGLLS